MQHRVELNGSVRSIAPGSLVLYVAAEAVQRTESLAPGAVVTLANVRFKRPIFLDGQQSTFTQLLVRLLTSTSEFEVFANGDFSACVAEGTYEYSHDGLNSKVAAPSAVSSNTDAFYASLRARGYHYGERFRRVTASTSGDPRP